MSQYDSALPLTQRTHRRAPNGAYVAVLSICIRLLAYAFACRSIQQVAADAFVLMRQIRGLRFGLSLSSAFVYSSVRCSSSVGCCFAPITSPLSTCPQLSFLKGQTGAWLWLSINTCWIPSVSSWGCMVLPGRCRGPRPLRCCAKVHHAAR